MRVHILHTGRVYIDRSLAYREKSLHPAPYTGWFRGKEKKLWVPVSSYLIEHSKGTVLVDTGWHEEIRVNPRRHLGSFAYSMFKGELPKGDSIAEQLQRLGIKTKDIDYVILSHMHSDHVSGLRHVQDAKKILTSEMEWRAAQKQLGYIKSMWKGIPIDTFKLEGIPFGPYQKGYDLFADGTLYLVHTPGHSEGMVSLLIRLQDQWLLLASDVGYATRSWEHLILPGLTTDKKAAYQSLQWVQDFSQREDCLRVIANHDPNVKPEVMA
ncbi:glyoxylase-like metal-dependent hydrolase (beta-lactamase superfamily II) [Pullulanibacillus pueri]|uniref:Metallo-beta-lactamase domain-containing protein n=1 Tax=Pullulanibacillus pueri TaxID=1437324 RepID=A0A8J2ZYG8_9BACL|nr:N-acyl homoserine lactonase family protein [Pullulanibacillus pueri]MBM7683383.1 glyoxylase-like metal-dependent hydrolase (beta-lactamase superfamily II) [Pullulanibacillus pueri]GGH86533.1 hypothetical protein GCM10007096_34460 [Pullulanibacillus pueri]